MLNEGIPQGAPYIPILGSLSATSHLLQISSVHRTARHPILRLPNFGHRSKTFRLQWPSVRLETLPTHFHFCVLIIHAMSITSVICRITSFLSYRETPVSPSVMSPDESFDRSYARRVGWFGQDRCIFVQPL